MNPDSAVCSAARLPGLLLLALSLPFAASAQSDEKPAELTEIVVEGDPEAVTEGAPDYAATHATVGGKQPLAILDVPQTVNVLTEALLEDANANSLEEAAYLLPNVTEATGSGFIGSLYSRGYEVFTYNIDGAPRPFLSLYGTAPDLVFFDRVEVLSGPSGVFQGTGEPVGTVNLVRKRATRDFRAEVELTGGSFDTRRIEGDVSGPLGASGNLRGRAIAYALDEESFLDFAQREREGVYATLEFDPTERLSLAVGGIVEDQFVSSHGGLPTFNDGRLLDVPIRTYIGAPWNANDQSTAEGFVEAERVFAGGGVLKFVARTYDRDADIKNALALTGVDPATGDFRMFTFARNFEETTDYVDLNFTRPLAIGSGGSEFTLGADLRRTDQGFVQNFDFGIPQQNIAAFDPRSLAEPEIGFPGVGPGFRLNTTTNTDEQGVYGFARLVFLDRARLTLGGRYITYDSVSRDTGRDRVTADLEEDRFVPFVGAGYDVGAAAVVYASYSEIFQPQNGNLATGARIDPLEGRQVEIGIKAQLFRDAIFQAALFRVEDENRAISDPDNVGAVIPADEAVNRGLEITLLGELLPGLAVTTGYAYVDTDLETAPTPEHTFNAWARYDFAQLGAPRFHVGVGMRAVSDFDTVANGVRIEAPGYAVFDALLGYRISDTVEAQLFVSNLADREYVNRINNLSRGTFFGEPRGAEFRLSFRF